MSWQRINSSVTINSSLVPAFTFSGVHDIVINKSLHSVVQTAKLTLPSIARFVPKNGSTPVWVTTGTQFADGDPITINLGYNGQMNNEFVGFVKRRDLAMPLVVECEGYVRQLRLNNAINANFTKVNTSAKALLELACQGTDITVQCPVDFPLSGIRLVNADGLRICDYIKEASDHTLFSLLPQLRCGAGYPIPDMQQEVEVLLSP